MLPVVVVFEDEPIVTLLVAIEEIVETSAVVAVAVDEKEILIVKEKLPVR